MDLGLFGVALGFPSRNFSPYRITVWEPTIQTLTCQYGELDLSHVEPTAMLGGVMKLELADDAAGFGRRVVRFRKK